MVRKSNSRSIQRRPSPRRARRRDARRDDILRAAARTFRIRGVAETGMRDIAEAADLSPANLYHYFRGKDEIVFYCQDRALDRLIAAVADARRAAAAPGDRLHRVLASHARILLDEVSGGAAHLETAQLPASLRTRIVAKRDRYERAVRRLLQDGMAAGAFVTHDPAVVARAMLGALNWTATWFDPAGSRSADDIGHEIARFMVRGIRATSPGGRRALRLVPELDPRTA